MSSSKPAFDDLIDALKQQRDELRVKMNLGSKEAKQEFEALEKKMGPMVGAREGGVEATPGSDRRVRQGRGIGARARAGSGQAGLRAHP